MHRLTVRHAQLVIVLLALCVPACIPLPRYAAVSSPAVAPAADETYGLDPWLLAEGLTDRVVVEIDWVEGCKPGPLTVQGLHDLLVELGPPGRSVEVVLDDEISREAWDEARAEQGVHDPVDLLVERYAYLAGEPFDAGSRVERRYALFVPDAHGNFGYSASWPVSRGDETTIVRGVVVSRGLHARYGEAADLMGELLSRGHDYWFTPAVVERYQADLLRRAGRLDEAQAIVQRGLCDRKTRAGWTDGLSAAILEAAGEADEARALRERALAVALEREAQAETDEARRETAIRVAVEHASLSQPEPARAALERAAPPPPSDSKALAEQQLRVWVLATLGDLDQAAELLREPSMIEARGFGSFDPCGVEALEPMLADPRYADVVGHCPRAVHDEGGSGKR